MLEKIKEFFKNIFKVNRRKCIEAPKKISFKDKVVEERISEGKILKLQQDIEEGLIKEEQLSNIELDKLIMLYDKQIEEKKQTIEEYKRKIIYLKTKLVEN